MHYDGAYWQFDFTIWYDMSHFIYSNEHMIKYNSYGRYHLSNIMGALKELYIKAKVKNFIQWYKWTWFLKQCWCHHFSINNTVPHKKWIWLLSIYHSDTNWHRCWWQMLWDKYVDDRYGHLCQHFWLNYPTEVIKISTTFENCHLVCGVSDTVSAITLVQYRQFLVSQSLNSLSSFVFEVFNYSKKI